MLRLLFVLWDCGRAAAVGLLDLATWAAIGLRREERRFFARPGARIERDGLRRLLAESARDVGRSRERGGGFGEGWR